MQGRLLYSCSYGSYYYRHRCPSPPSSALQLADAESIVDLLDLVPEGGRKCRANCPRATLACCRCYY